MWWNQDAWQQMPLGGANPPDDILWDGFYSRFKFRPGMESSPAIDEPTPSLTFDLTPIFDAGRDGFSAGEDRLNAEVLEAFKAVFRDSRIAVLDWQHPSYWLRPAAFDPSDPEDWAVTVFPNGDYYIFTAEDLSCGTFGHPWEQTLCVWGEPLVSDVRTRLSAWLPIRRTDGKPVGDR